MENRIMNKYVMMDMQTDDQYDYKNLAKLDLRNISVEIAKSMKGIKNVACIIVPSDNNELESVIMAVPKKNVATILRLPSKGNMYEYSGKIAFTPENLPKEHGYFFVQGIAYFTNPNNVEMSNIKLSAVGEVFIGANVNIDVIQVTGIQKKGEFLYVNEFKGDVLNREYIENLKPKTLLYFGQNDKVKIDKNLTVDDLKSKEIIVYYDENVTKLKGNQAVMNYINSTLI